MHDRRPMDRPTAACAVSTFRVNMRTGTWVSAWARNEPPLVCTLDIPMDKGKSREELSRLTWTWATSSTGTPRACLCTYICRYMHTYTNEGLYVSWCTGHVNLNPRTVRRPGWREESKHMHWRFEIRQCRRNDRLWVLETWDCDVSMMISISVYYQGKRRNKCI